jgi:transcription antitermination factor NusG
MFPGYVFCKISFPEDYHSVRWLRGVLCLVQFGEAAPPALDEEVKDRFGREEGSCTYGSSLSGHY